MLSAHNLGRSPSAPRYRYLVLGTDLVPYAAIPFDSLQDGGMAGFIGRVPAGSIDVDTPIEALGDPWRVLRLLRDHLALGGRISMRTSFAHGKGVGESYVRSLFLLAGFDPPATRRTPDGRTYTASRREVTASAFSCSVVVPCRNEVGNIKALVERLPEMGTHTELLFVDGNSTDGTVEAVEQVIAGRPAKDIRLIRQGASRGKAEAVFQGFDAAHGDVLLILDADMTVAPEDLPRFYLALAEGVTSFANGTRFAFPMADGAMPFANQLGNRAFSRAFSWMLGTSITDTLCGTKAFRRQDWPAIAAARRLFGNNDPWGDFDLLFGARHLGLSILDVPVRYGARTAGESKMRPLVHGPVLARAAMAGIRRFKLAPPDGRPWRE